MRTTQDQTTPWPPADAIAVQFDGATWTIYEAGDTPPAQPIDDDAAMRAQFEAYKARSGEPSYKAAAVKIAAEKLALTPLIEAALDVLINADGDKALLVWWIETDAISRGDAQWQRIEAAVEWPKDVTAADLFDLAAQI